MKAMTGGHGTLTPTDESPATAETGQHGAGGPGRTGDAQPAAPPPSLETIPADVEELRSLAGDQAPATTTDLALRIQRDLSDANQAAHTLAKLDTSGELSEALDAIGRAKRLVNARYLC